MKFHPREIISMFFSSMTNFQKDGTCLKTRIGILELQDNYVNGRLDFKCVFHVCVLILRSACLSWHEFVVNLIQAICYKCFISVNILFILILD